MYGLQRRRTGQQQHGEHGQESCLPAAESALEERLDHRVPVVKKPS
jgi:hypothetical protein